MKLNIITAGANSVGQAILERVANPNDMTIALSRRGTSFDNAINLKVSDLTNREELSKALFEVFSQIATEQVKEVRLFHNCCYAVCEIPHLERDFPEHADNPKLKMRDEDGDGIDDRAYHSLLTTFRNVLGNVLERYPEKNLSIGTICSLTDKKSYIPTVFQSMVKTNNMLREELKDLVITNKNMQGVCISASTVRTETEDNFRTYCTDKEYWVSANKVADTLVVEMEGQRNVYKDVDIYIHNPKYNEYYKNETDEQMTERLKREIGLVKN